MNFLEHAKKLAKLGFHVFPLVPGSKLPAISDFPEAASCEPSQLDAFWLDDVMGIAQPFNVGISTSRFGKGALLVVDVDNKGTKNGSETMVGLELEGREFPPTFTQKTPTGGLHLVYSVPKAVKQGVDVLGHGLDVRSRGGFIVGAGSVTEAGEYIISDFRKIAPAPKWMIDACGPVTLPEPSKLVSAKTLTAEVDQKTARMRAEYYLLNRAPLAVEGQGGDAITFKVCCAVKDTGLAQGDAVELIHELWNSRCSPPWRLAELTRKVANAYNYGRSKPGSEAPEAQFDAIVDPQEVHPFEKLNREFAFCVVGSGYHILWEKRDSDGGRQVLHLNEMTFHKLFAAQTMTLGNGRKKAITELWLEHADRRTYDGICFKPGLTAPKGYYNLWAGFSVELPEGEPGAEAKWSLDAFLEHAKTNVCGNDEKLFRWLMGYFAHLIQKPWEKPLVALVFRGKKGTGKNALIDQLAALMRGNSLVTSNRRYLTGNFNSHLENLLLFVLDEAFWSGDKATEGVLKDLITGHAHVIEHKGQEPYKVDNCTRVVILGNEDWLVPATQDERRFAVFTVGEGRMQDRDFFTRMRKGMESGGHSLLLSYLMAYDLSGVDVNAAPVTKGLLDQKIESMSAFHQWMFNCLYEGKIEGLDFVDGWPTTVEKETLRSAMLTYTRARNIRAWNPDARQFGNLLRGLWPEIGHGQTLKMPPLPAARAAWERFIGQKIEWFSPDEGEKSELKDMLS